MEEASESEDITYGKFENRVEPRNNRIRPIFVNVNDFIIWII
ncbi:MAG: hypothetical protein RTV31_08350 [Candidatus Thorarchaeota archaeon]